MLRELPVIDLGSEAATDPRLEAGKGKEALKLGERPELREMERTSGAGESEGGDSLAACIV